MDWRCGARISAGARNFLLLQNVQNVSGSHPASFNAYCFLSQGKSGRLMMSTSHLHLAPSLRMSEAIPLLLLRAFMAWTGTTLPLPLPLQLVKSKFVFQVSDDGDYEWHRCLGNDVVQSGRYVILILGAADSFQWLVHIYETKGCEFAEMINFKELQINRFYPY